MAIELAKFKLQYGTPTAFKEIAPSKLKEVAPYFRKGVSGEWIFRAPVNVKTTKGSKYPRSELREMYNDDDEADWSSSSGYHQMIANIAFLHLPNDTPNLVGCQIHDGDDDITVFRLEGKKLWITDGNNLLKMVTDKYELGTIFEVRYLVYKDKITVYYNGISSATIARKFIDAYFKAGAYTQANCDKSKPCAETNYGEVAVYSLMVIHTSVPVDPAPTPTPVPPTPVPDPGPAPVPDPTPTPTPVPPITPADDVLLIIRHGEKPIPGSIVGITANGDADDHSLIVRGWVRAGALIAFFTSGKVPRATAVVASQGTTKSRRPAQTVTYVAAALGLPLIIKYDIEVQIKETAAFLNARHGTTIVSMEHQSVVPLLEEMGANTPFGDWPDNRFDILVVATRVGAGKWVVTQRPQLLLPGDLPAVL